MGPTITSPNVSAMAFSIPRLTVLWKEKAETTLLSLINSTVPDGMITVSKGHELAERLGTCYCESSDVTGEGVHAVINTAVRLAIQNHTPSKTRFKVFQWQKKMPKIYRHGPDPPVLSPPGL